jgi:hypothetical protein
VAVVAAERDILDFARQFLRVREIRSHEDVRTEDLAESFREWAGLPPFPSTGDLMNLCLRLGITLDWAPMPPGMLGANVWLEGRSPWVVVRSGLAGKQRRTTIGHELREVIEIAFGKVRPSYVGLKTHENRVMNPESDHFAACLVLQADATDAALKANGYDFVQFASDRRVALAAVVRRAQEIYSAKSTRGGPTGGLFLFETPWESIGKRDAIFSMKLKVTAKLSGFSLAKPRSAKALNLRAVFPSGDCQALRFGIVTEALGRRLPVTKFLKLSAPSGGDRWFVAVAEPTFNQQAQPYQVLLSALETDGDWRDLRPWVSRTGASQEIVRARTTL